MKTKKSIKDFKKLEKNDLKKIKGGAGAWMYIDGVWCYLEY